MVRRGGGGKPDRRREVEEGCLPCGEHGREPFSTRPGEHRPQPFGSLVEAGSQRRHQGCIPSNADKLLDFVHMRGQLFNDG